MTTGWRSSKPPGGVVVVFHLYTPRPHHKHELHPPEGRVGIIADAAADLVQLIQQPAVKGDRVTKKAACAW